MNGTPHIHQLRLARWLEGIDEGHWCLKYGEQEIRLCAGWRNPHGWPPEKLLRVLRRKSVVVIRRHDQASLMAQKRHDKQDDVSLALAEVQPKGLDRWGSALDHAVQELRDQNLTEPADPAIPRPTRWWY